MSNSEILLYQTEDGQTKIDVRLEEETVWLSQAQMVELFQTTKQNISLHIKNIYEEGELDEISTVKDYLTVQTEGKREVQRSLKFYNLDVIISVGYRVKSHRGTQFRIWATQQLKEFLIKGFLLNDEKLKETGHTNPYFDELLDRIRDIRSSEKIFYAKIRDWKRFLIEEKSWFRKFLPSQTTRVITNTGVNFSIIIGRRTDNQLEIEKRNQIADEMRISIRSFDSLTDILRKREFFPSAHLDTEKGDFVENQMENPFYKAINDSDWKKFCRNKFNWTHFHKNNYEQILKLREYNDLIKKWKNGR